MKPETVRKIEQYLSHQGQPQGIDHDKDWVIILSQSCDLVAKTIQQEPFVEVLHCHPKSGDPRKEFIYPRSTRRIEFCPNQSTHPNIILTAHAIEDRYIIPRDIFSQEIPDTTRSLDERSIKRIGSWYALRYSRPAWPDSFVQRVSPKREKFEKLLMELGSDINDVEVRIALSPNDKSLPKNRPYRVVVWFVVDGNRWEGDPPLREKAQETYNKFIALLKTCQGLTIEINESGVVSGEDFSWQQTHMSDEWNFANLSMAEE